ncbi:hypothetical protein [Rheinheimera oceanensis]|uniref:hypothetical protein n=1 Tax=Rheinheimera oceanensis TaxID=2817449 RepID=UPI001BFD0886|nr:hypothetical protein [Rheinheimera oceanensis]
MLALDARSLSVCIQALQTAIKYNDFLSQSATVDADDYEESSYMFELELAKLIDLYQQEEAAGNVNIPLAELLKPPFDGSSGS